MFAGFALNRNETLQKAAAWRHPLSWNFLPCDQSRPLPEPVLSDAPRKTRATNAFHFHPSPSGSPRLRVRKDS